MAALSCLDLAPSLRTACQAWCQGCLSARISTGLNRLTFHELLRAQLKGHADENFLLERPLSVSVFTRSDCLPADQVTARVTDCIGNLVSLRYRDVELHLLYHTPTPSTSLRR